MRSTEKKSGLVRALTCIALVFALAAGCGKTVGSDLGGETHWLKNCDTQAECGSELACLCGVCTRSCDASEGCGDLGSSAECLDRDAAPFGSGCTSEAPPRLCAQSEDPDGSNEPGDTREQLSASRYDEANDCFGPREIAGRAPTPGELLCNDAMTHALDAEGSCWLFPSTCLPLGFSEIDTASAELPPCRQTFRYCTEGAEVPCAERDLESCVGEGECTVAGGWPYDAANECFRYGVDDIVPLACVDADLTCPPDISFGLDVDGNCYAFGNCVPEGFTDVPAEHACHQALGASCSP